MSHHAIAERIVEVLGHRPSGLFSDFDGVLSEIAPTPDEAVLYPGMADAFARVGAEVDVAGVITGRAVDDVGTRVPIDNLIVVGNHGLEWSEYGERHDHQAGTAVTDGLADLIRQTREQLASQIDISRIIWENKRLSGTIHFRNADDPAYVESLIMPIVLPLAEANGLRVAPGKMSLELRPLVMVTKGTALARIIETRGLESTVFIGDDLTDVDGFRTLHELRTQGKHTLAIGVVTADSHPDVAAHADVMVNSVHEFVDVLAQVGQMLGER